MKKIIKAIFAFILLVVISTMASCKKQDMTIQKTNKMHKLKVYVYSSKIGRSTKFYDGYNIKETGALLTIDGEIPNVKWWSNSQGIQELEVSEGSVVRFIDNDPKSAAYIWDEIYIDDVLVEKKQCQCYVDVTYKIK